MAPPPDIDRAQLATLVRLRVLTLLRPGLNASTRTRFNPVRSLIVPMLMMGGFWSFSRPSSASTGAVLTMLFACVGTLVLGLITPDAEEVRRSELEALHCRPIATATLVASQVALLLVTGALLGGLFALPTLLSLVWNGRLPPLAAGAQLLAVVACGAATAILWLHAYSLLVPYVSREKARRICTRLTTFTSVGVLVVPLALSGMPALLDLAGPAGTLQWLPFVWFSHLASPSLDVTSLARAGGALLLLALAIATPWSRRIQRTEEDLADAAGAEPLTGEPLGARLLGAFAALPRIGRYLAPPVAAALARAILTLASREDTARSTLFGHRLALVVVFGIALFQSNAQLAVASVGILLAISSADLAGRSSHAAASWLIFASPVTPAESLRAVRLAVTAQAMVLPVALVAILALVSAPDAAPWLIAGYALCLRAAVAATTAVVPVAPLASEHRTLSAPTVTLVGLALSLPYLVVSVLAVKHAGPTPLVITLALVAAATAALNRVAAARAARLTYGF